MTQELVIGVLLTGLVGLIWAMTVALIWGDHPVGRESEIVSSESPAAVRSADKGSSTGSSLTA
jgi:hypothetical protein